MNDTLNDLQKEESREELEKLYDKLTKMGIKELRVSKGDFQSTIYVVLTSRNLVCFPLGPEEEVSTLLKGLLKTGRALAVILVFRGWILDLNEDTRLEERFISVIDSVEMKKTKSWKIKRDDRRKMIFPLRDPEVFPEYLEFMSRLTGNYFSSKQETDMKN